MRAPSGFRSGPRRRGLVAASLTATTLALCAVALPAHAGDAPTPTDSTAIVQAVADGTLAQISGGGHGAIERGHVQAAISSAEAAFAASQDAWSDGPGATVSSGAGSFSVAFDNGRGSASGLPDSFGTRAAILTVSPTGYARAVVTLAGDSVVCALPPAVDTAAGLLAAVGSNMTCPTDTIATPAVSAITSTWAWGNSVDPALDNRGLGEPVMAPAAIAAFASAHSLSSVYLSAPWASNDGAIASWLADAVDALHADGIRVAALGCGPSWLATPGLVAQWVADARAAADFDAVQLDVEPWAGVADPDFAAITPRFLDLLAAAKTAAGPLPVGVDLPWWLTTKSFDSTTVFAALLGRADSVAIVAFSDHADGVDGIVGLAAPAVASAAALGTPFTVGVETDSPEITGGQQYTFFGNENATLEAECAKVRDAFASTPGYGGVTAEHLLSWTALIG